METPAITELEELKECARARGASEETVDGLVEVQAMAQHDVLGVAEYERRLIIGSQSIDFAVAVGTSQEEVEDLLDRFVSDVRAALNAIPVPTKSPDPLPPPMPEPESLETDYRMRNFELQMRERLSDLDSFGIIDITHPKIKGIDNKEYVPPLWAQIKAALTPEKLALIGQLENPTLLLVPEMSLSEYAGKACEDKQPPKRKLSWSRSQNLSLDVDENGTLISGVIEYHKDPKRHKGKTKAERIAPPYSLGWQVLVVDGGEEAPVSTFSKSADTLLTEFRQANFSGLSVEAYFALQMHGQVRGTQFDRQNSVLLLESYLTEKSARGVVLYAQPQNSGVHLVWCGPGSLGSHLGARRAVRVL